MQGYIIIIENQNASKYSVQHAKFVLFSILILHNPCGRAGGVFAEEAFQYMEGHVYPG